MTGKKRRSVQEKAGYGKERNPLDYMAEFDVINGQLKVTFNIYKDVPGCIYSVPYEWRYRKYHLISRVNKWRSFLTIVSYDDAGYIRLKTVYLKHKKEGLCDKTIGILSKAVVCDDALVLLSRYVALCLNLEELDIVPSFTEMETKGKICPEGILIDDDHCYYLGNNIMLLTGCQREAYLNGRWDTVVLGLSLPDLNVISRIELDPGDSIKELDEDNEGHIVLKCVKSIKDRKPGATYVDYVIDRKSLTLTGKVCS